MIRAEQPPPDPQSVYEKELGPPAPCGVGLTPESAQQRKRSSSKASSLAEVTTLFGGGAQGVVKEGREIVPRSELARSGINGADTVKTLAGAPSRQACLRVVFDGLPAVAMPVLSRGVGEEGGAASGGGPVILWTDGRPASLRSASAVLAPTMNPRATEYISPPGSYAAMLPHA
eukprot:scaffold22893_cov27-Tisochrysis_lutea.AAC.8